jgi:hypothetical protein
METFINVILPSGELSCNLPRSSESSDEWAADPIGETVIRLSRQELDLAPRTLIAGSRRWGWMRVHAQVLRDEHSPPHVEWIADDEKPAQAMLCRHLASITEILLRRSRLCLGQDIGFGHPALKSILSGNYRFGRFIAFALTARENDLVDLPTLVKLNRVVDPFSKDRRRLLSPRRRTKNNSRIRLKGFRVARVGIDARGQPAERGDDHAHNRKQDSDEPTFFQPRNPSTEEA